MLCLTGCLEKEELRDRAIAQCFGVDYENGKYKITLQIFNSADSQEGKSADKNSLVTKSEGKTLTEAIYNMNDSLGKTVFLGNNKVILIGKETAKNGISDIIDFFNADYQTRVRTMILICEDTAEKSVSAKNKDELISSKDIFSVAKINKNHGIMGKSDILTVETSLNSDACNGFLLGYMKIKKDGDKIYPEIAGSALFKGDKMVDIYDKSESEGAAWVLGKPKLICINGKTDKGVEFSVTAKKPKSKISGNIDKDKAKIKIKVEFDGKISELNRSTGSGISIEEIEEIEHISSEIVKSKINNAVRKSIENGSDAFNFDNCLSGKNKDFVNKNMDNWENKIKDFQIEIDVKCILERPLSKSKNNF